MKRYPDIEICIESEAELDLARSHSMVKRVELCSALDVGGLSPHPLMTHSCTEKKGHLEVHCMVRPRPGDFCYSKKEISQMMDEIQIAKDQNADGVVFGCLHPDGQINMKQTKELIDQADQLALESTFHRAFDICSHPQTAIDELIDLGVTRILTSGQRRTAEKGLDLISNLVHWSGTKMEIMAGSGINSGNVAAIASAGVDAIHFTCRKPKSDEILGFGMTFEPDQDKLVQILGEIQRN